MVKTPVNALLGAIQWEGGRVGTAGVPSSMCVMHFGFSQVQLTVKGQCADSIQDTGAAMTGQLVTLIKGGSQICFRERQEGCDNCSN